MKWNLDSVMEVLNYSVVCEPVAGDSGTGRIALLVSGTGHMVQVVCDTGWMFVFVRGETDAAARRSLVDLVSGKSVRVSGPIPQTVVFPVLEDV